MEDHLLFGQSHIGRRLSRGVLIAAGRAPYRRAP
jgi:hypothetical protein